MNRKQFFKLLVGLFGLACLPLPAAAVPPEEQFECLHFTTSNAPWWEPIAWNDIQTRCIIRRMSDPDKVWSVIDVSGKNLSSGIEVVPMYYGGWIRREMETLQ